MSQKYFAYGSNMKLERIKLFIPQAQPIGAGQLLDHKLGFTNPLNEEFRNQWGGAPANVYSMEGECVWGIVYDVGLTNFDIMDRLEKGYQRTLLPVLVNGVIEEIWLYKLLEETPEVHGNVVPQPGSQYMSLLLEGARQHGLPETYIEFLAGIKTSGNADLEEFHQTSHSGVVCPN